MILEKNYSVDASFLAKYNIILTPQEILWGMNRGFIRPKTVIDYVVSQLSNLKEEDILYEIALLNKNERYLVREILEERLKPEVKDSKIIWISNQEALLEKWLYLLLKWLYDRQASFDDPFGIIEEIYAFLDYPQSIEGFVRYMPIDEREHTQLNPLERMKTRWRLFLEEKDKKFMLN